MRDKKFLRVSLLIITLLFPAISLADADRIFKENSKAVVVVVTYDQKGKPISQGSGFIVRADGAIVTNYHVISNAKNIKIKAGAKVLDVEGLLHIDKENDLVLLKVKGSNLPKVKIGAIEKVSIGEKVYVISSPEGFENTISDGILSGIREVDSNRKILQITAPISKGSSGGPVFNKNGEVIGIVTFLIETAQSLNFAMPVNLIKDKIESKTVTALKDFAIEDYKKSADYWYYLGINYNLAEMYEEAIEAFKHAVKIKPDFNEAYLELAFIYNYLRPMYEEAVEVCKQAIRLDPNNARAHYELGSAHFRLADGLNSASALIRIDFPDRVSPTILDLYKKAIESFKEAIRLKPDYALAHDIHYKLGLAYFNLSKYREATEAFREAIEAFKEAIRLKFAPLPEKAYFPYFYLGRSYSKLGMFGEAIEAYKQAIRIMPDDNWVHYELGLAYLSIGNRGMALEQYKILKQLAPVKAEELFKLIYK